MGRVQFERIKVRDGKEMPVWITVPPGDVKARPAVVLVHGGPWSRGRDWVWEPESQFLASRGYVVVEPEFRGSTGYGDDWYRAGWKQWGQAMQDDVSDALMHAVAKGWVDPARVCIAGASYGGYATLMGLAKDPDQYRCGVAWVGVSDPMMMYTLHWSDFSDFSKSQSMPVMIGDPVADLDMLKRVSPLEQAARIKAPLMLAYGGKDRRVPIEHGERLRDRLRALGRDPVWVVYDDEGHGWARPGNQVDFWRRVEDFLAKNLR
jgi:dipeptidyl aminopeptidase/acylaminoacyl peptidase